jgi:hypothetical protein
MVEKDHSILEELDQWYKVYSSRKKRHRNGAFPQESKYRKRRTKRLARKEALAGQGTWLNPLIPSRIKI